MKSSKYNYIVPFGNKYIFFNGITEAFFTVSRKNVDLYRTLLSYPEDNFESFPSFIDKRSGRKASLLKMPPMSWR